MIDDTVGPSLETLRLHEHVTALQGALTSTEPLDKKRVLEGLAVTDMLGEAAQEKGTAGFKLAPEARLRIQIGTVSLILAADSHDRIEPPLSSYVRSSLELRRLTDEARLAALEQQNARPFGTQTSAYYYSRAV